MKLSNSKVVVGLLIVVAVLLIANLVSLWVQQAGVQAQSTSNNRFTIAPISTGGFNAFPPAVIWGMYAVVDQETGNTSACYAYYNPATKKMQHECLMSYTAERE